MEVRRETGAGLEVTDETEGDPDQEAAADPGIEGAEVLLINPCRETEMIPETKKEAVKRREKRKM